MKNNFFTILLTTGVITTLLTSIINIIMTITTNNNVKAVEKLKRQYQIDFMRFEKVNSLRIELEKLLFFLPNDVISVTESSEKKGEAVTRLINESEELIKLFELNMPFFDKDLRDSLDKKRKTYVNLRWDLQQIIISGGGTIKAADEKKFDENLSTLFTMGYEFKKDFEAMVQQQMTRLDITKN